MRLVSLLCLMAGLVPASANDFFVAEIRPLLQQNCVGCHGAQSKVDLSSPAAIAKFVKPGKPDESPLYQAIAHTGRMRMPLGKPQLPAAALAKVANWIRAGAEAGPAQHWAFTKPQRRNPPAPGNPVDAFLNATLKREGLTPAAPADKRTLLRRVWEVPQIGPADSWGGVLSTGGVIFFGEDSGALGAVDAKTGKDLWHIQTNSSAALGDGHGWRSSPMTYMAGGKQYIAFAAGPNILAFALP